VNDIYVKAKNLARVLAIFVYFEKWVLDLTHNTHEDEQSMDNTFGVFTNRKW
jgi:hypothetical protein